MTSTSPVRYPDTSSPAGMTRRARWLIGLNIVLPGSAQVLAGKRKLGSFALGATFVLVVLAVIAAILWFAARTVMLTIVTSPIGLTVIQIALLGYGVLWFVLAVDTLRLAQLSKAWPAARLGLALFTAVSIVVTVGTAGYGAYLAGVGRGAIAAVFADGHIEPPIDGRYNILLLGGDAGPDRMGLRPDSISVVSIDAATGLATIIGVPRNLEQAPFIPDSPMLSAYPDGYDCGDECLISFLYTYGQEHPDLYPGAEAAGSTPGIEAMRDSVEAVVGLTMQYYVLIDMQGFSNLIDALGGIDITVTKRLPIEGGVDGNGKPINVSGWIEPGAQHMNGYTALWYARSRHGTSDYDRMARQREVQEAILKQAEPASVLSKFQAVAEAGADVVKTDIPSGMLGYFVDLASKARSQPITTLDLVPPEVVTAHPDIAAIQAAVKAVLVVPSSSPTPAG